MKKRIIFSVIAVVLSCVCGLTACGQSGGDKNNGGDNSYVQGAEYIIQYVDDSGPHQITVTGGMPYSIETLPSREGYVFTGLFDAEVGGTQYVSAAGASLSPYTDGKNLVLFPQFKAKEYTFVLDYQGARVTGERQITASYNQSLPELPKNLEIDHKTFKGWFTETDCGGLQVADEYGLIPVVSVVKSDNFDLSAENLYLYAGFEWEKVNVTCYFGGSVAEERVQVDWGSSVSDIIPKTRVDGKAPLTWSKFGDGEIYTGLVEDGMILHAEEFAPIIEFDANGGKAVKPIVKRAGTSITLPTTTKATYKFSHWEDAKGDKFEVSAMPQKSVTLTAVWNAMIVFDENGGSEVDDISVAKGNAITLPVTEKGGYIFAGWYTSDKIQYTSTTMPAAGIVLKAGWYKANEDTVVLIASNKTKGDQDRSPNMSSSLCFTFDFDSFFQSNQKVNVIVDWHVKMYYSNISTFRPVYLNIYSKREISSNNLLYSKTFNEVAGEYKTITFRTNFAVSEDFYLCWWGGTGAYPGITLIFSDFYYTVHYPDTTTLYL